MLRIPPLLTLGFLGLVSGSAPRQTEFQDQCQNFDPAQAGLANATVAEHAFVSAGSTIALPDNDPTCALTSQIVAVDLCRVALHVNTTDRSSLVAEIWLPASWNGRLVTTGNGGLGGCIDYSSIAYTSLNGFASVGTNNGHNGTLANQFLNNPDVVTDFAWRALHVGVEAGKALVSSFYENGANSSYLLACSLGGRQAIKAAEMFPDDFNGIVAGCPAVDFNNLYSWRASFYPITGAIGSDNFIDSDTWETTIHNEVLRQCDTIDGVADGIIEDSSLCHFDPSTLLCQSGVTDNSTCLTSAQVEIVQKVYSPYTWEDGTLLYPAMNPGSEINTAVGLLDGEPWAYSQSWFRYAVYNNPDWDPANYSLKDAAFADRVNPGNIRTWPSSLLPFQSRGGRLVMYHGGQDNQISSFNTPRFYEYLRAGMNYTTDDMDEFIRFFRISGMFHCSSGPGAWVVGQGGGASAQGPFDRQHNVLAAVVDWFEQDLAPETLTGTKYINDTASLGVSFTRDHCRWPFRNTYLGGGLDPNDPASWECQPISAAEEAVGASGLE